MLRSPEAVRDFLVRRYRNQQRNWLAGNGHWPLQIPLGCPTEEQALRLADSIPAWVEAWRGWVGPGTVAWSERRWRSFGTQRLPERLIVDSANDAAYLAGDENRWSLVCRHYGRLTRRWPQLAEPLAQRFDALASFDDYDAARIEALLAWLELHQKSQLFLRQLPIPGMDTKWLEPRLPMIADLLAVMRSDAERTSNIYQYCGLRQIPQSVRIRILDPSLRRHVGGLSDITIPVEELRALKLPAERVVIVENLQTGLASEERSGDVLVMGLGYGVTALAGIPWIDAATCTYWGDLDTHGFAILNRVRGCLKHVGSMLMDESTLLRYRDLWVTEKEQCSATDLPLLTDAEHAVYRGLKEQKWGTNVRLEQERIAWNEVRDQ